MQPLIAQASGVEILMMVVVLLHLGLPILGAIVQGMERHQRAARRSRGGRGRRRY